ncbi:MAG: hypothetical protein LT103_05670 [Burkholderiaceae bacterium]|nr:hypothetical protein [Burkholderiaceae bacterium]
MFRTVLPVTVALRFEIATIRVSQRCIVSVCVLFESDHAWAVPPSIAELPPAEAFLLLSVSIDADEFSLACGLVVPPWFAVAVAVWATAPFGSPLLPLAGFANVEPEPNASAIAVAMRVLFIRDLLEELSWKHGEEALRASSR